VALAAQPQPHLASTETGDEPVAHPLGGDERDQLLVT
jgi:hypothetical protein